MLALVFRLFEHMLIGVCLTSLSMVFVSLTALLRLLPRSLPLIRRGLRGFLVLSFRFYRLLFTHLAPTIQRWLDIDILRGYSRVAAAVVASLVLGLSLICLTNLPINGWGVGLALLHGLTVGSAWDEIESPRGLQLGVEIE